MLTKSALQNEISSYLVLTDFQVRSKGTQRVRKPSCWWQQLASREMSFLTNSAFALTLIIWISTAFREKNTEVYYSPFHICCSLKDSVAKNFMKHHLVMIQEMISQCILCSKWRAPSVVHLGVIFPLCCLNHRIKLRIWNFSLNGHWPIYIKESFNILLRVLK